MTAVVDEVDVRGVVEAMEAVAAQLGSQVGVLKAFSTAVERYRREREPHQQEGPVQAEGLEGAEDPGGVASASSRVIAQAALGGAALLPGVGVLAGMTSPEIAAQGLDRLRTGIRGRARRVRDDPLSDGPVRALSSVFVQELERLAEEHPWLVLAFDTWELTGRYLDTWVRALLLDEYGPMPANVLVVLAGQNELGEREWAELRGQITDVPLEVFTEQEARALLTARGVGEDEGVVQEILHLSMGLPLLVDTLAHIHPGTAGDQQETGYSADVAVARFVRWIPDPDDQAAVLSCALPVRLNEDVFQAVVPSTAAGRYGWLCRQPFVTGHGAHRQYHDVVRTSMLRYLRTRSPLVWTERHTRLANAYARWRAMAEEHLPEKERWSDPDWRAHRLSETYHRLCAHPRRFLTAALEETIHAAGQDLETLRRWADTLVRAGRDTAHPGIAAWGDRLTGTTSGEQPFLDTLPALLSAPRLTATARAHAHTHHGEHLQLAVRVDEAVTAYGHAITADPTVAQAHIARGLAHRWSGRHEQALADLSHGVELDPEDARAFYERGGTYRLLGRYEEALSDYSRAIALDPTNTWAIALRGGTHLSMGRYEEALTDYNHAIALEPDNTSVITQRGSAYRLLHRYEEALTDYNRVIELEPDSTWTVSQRGATYRSLGRHEDALTDYTRVIELKPDSPQVHTFRSLLHRQMGHFDHARSDLDRAVRELSTDKDFQFELAMLNTLEFGLTSAAAEWQVLFSHSDGPSDISMGARFLQLFQVLLLEPSVNPVQCLEGVLSNCPDHDAVVDLFLYLKELEAVPGEHLPGVVLCLQYLVTIPRPLSRRRPDDVQRPPETPSRNSGPALRHRGHRGDTSCLPNSPKGCPRRTRRSNQQARQEPERRRAGPRVHPQ
ncbi:tetratricopeptide repeat protein [Streptomyces sp. NBC_00654]|uniref:tetratricopeptide repeat protein n=1 Tax=Streptomyces sp. NBC_00654 TaxID=2975799 RepID=UPI002252E378|nr:tetratricopeptide repeat protein [Streptomyces sp. NBC_00654]MCX4966898.1 tetratricopeptide repeat protein [Streptomyces sp. NBC_00654]